MRSEVVVLYHANCPDGFGSAWSFWKKFGKDAKYIAVSHGSPPPNVKDKEVYIVDFSYDRDVLLSMKERAKSLIVLDHHVTAMEKVGDLDFCNFDMNHSGAYISWRHLFGEDDVPNLILYIEDRDLWKWEMPFAEEILSSLDSYPKDFKTWDKIDGWLRDLESKQFNRMKNAGSGILMYKETLVSSLVKSSHELTICGHKVPSVNSSFFQSELGNTLSANNKFAAVYYYSGGEYKFSLRSKNTGLDVSKIASNYGGGGHKNAAGFSIKSLKDL